MSEAGYANPRASDDRALAMVLSVIERLSLVVQAENVNLSERRAVDYPTHSQRKSQGLLELNRVRPALASLSASPAAKAALAGLSAELEINHRLLRTQLKAAQTVSSLIARAIRDGQSDGTYAPFAWRVNEE
jgi:hypothetical protein